MKVKRISLNDSIKGRIMTDKTSKYVLLNIGENSSNLSEPRESYDDNKGFATLEAWIKSPEVL